MVAQNIPHKNFVSCLVLIWSITLMAGGGALRRIWLICAFDQMCCASGKYAFDQSPNHDSNPNTNPNPNRNPIPNPNPTLNLTTTKCCICMQVG